MPCSNVQYNGNCLKTPHHQQTSLSATHPLRHDPGVQVAPQQEQWHPQLGEEGVDRHGGLGGVVDLRIAMPSLGVWCCEQLRTLVNTSDNDCTSEEGGQNQVRQSCVLQCVYSSPRHHCSNLFQMVASSLSTACEGVILSCCICTLSVLKLQAAGDASFT